MFGDWQNWVAGPIVAVAVLYLIRTMRRAIAQRKSGCGGCGTCVSEPAVTAIDTSRLAESSTSSEKK